MDESQPRISDLFDFKRLRLSCVKETTGAGVSLPKHNAVLVIQPSSDFCGASETVASTVTRRGSDSAADVCSHIRTLFPDSDPVMPNGSSEAMLSEDPLAVDASVAESDVGRESKHRSSEITCNTAESGEQMDSGPVCVEQVDGEKPGGQHEDGEEPTEEAADDVQENSDSLQPVRNFDKEEQSGDAAPTAPSSTKQVRTSNKRGRSSSADRMQAKRFCRPPAGSPRRLRSVGSLRAADAKNAKKSLSFTGRMLQDPRYCRPPVGSPRKLRSVGSPRAADAKKSLSFTGRMLQGPRFCRPPVGSPKRMKRTTKSNKNASSVTRSRKAASRKTTTAGQNKDTAKQRAKPKETRAPSLSSPRNFTQRMAKSPHFCQPESGSSPDTSMDEFDGAFLDMHISPTLKRSSLKLNKTNKPRRSYSQVEVTSPLSRSASRRSATQATTAEQYAPRVCSTQPCSTDYSPKENVFDAFKLKPDPPSTNADHPILIADECDVTPSQLHRWCDNARSRLHLSDDLLNSVQTLIDNRDLSKDSTPRRSSASSEFAAAKNDEHMDCTSPDADASDALAAVSVNIEKTEDTCNEEPPNADDTACGVDVTSDSSVSEDEKPAYRCMARSGSCEDIFACLFHMPYAPAEEEEKVLGYITYLDDVQSLSC